MLNDGGEIREMNCILKSESPRKCYSQTRQVVFDQSYVLHRLKNLLQPFQGTFATDELLQLTKTAIEG